MFTASGKKICILIGNYLPGAHNDVKFLSYILKEFFDEMICIMDCDPLKVISELVSQRSELVSHRSELVSQKIELVSHNKLNENDLIYLHYSGHGVIRNKIYNGNVYKVTGWQTGNNTWVTTDKIQSLMANTRNKWIVSSDCCHSENFGFPHILQPEIYICSSKIKNYSTIYEIPDKKEKYGYITCIIYFLISQGKEINLDNLNSIDVKEFSKKLTRSKILYPIIKTQIQI